jgi:membrane protein DedA with SNARE-associated domain
MSDYGKHFDVALALFRSKAVSVTFFVVVTAAVLLFGPGELDAWLMLLGLVIAAVFGVIVSYVAAREVPKQGKTGR